MVKSLSIVIPTYNERDNVVPLVEAVDKALQGVDYEIVFVDDNSRDGTIDIARSLAAKFPVRILVRTQERGLATAVIHGFNNTTGKNVLVMDADLQHPPKVIPALLATIEKSDIAVASRYVPGGGCENWGLIRRITSRGSIAIAHLLLPRTRQVKDPSSGFFMLRRSVLDGARFSPVGYKILLELIYVGKYRTIAEVPFTFVVRTRGASKLKLKTEVDYLKHVFSLMQRGGELLRFIKFCLVGASGFAVNEGIYALLTRLAGMGEYSSQGVSIEVSVITNFVLNDFFTFGDRRPRGLAGFFTRLGKFNLVSLVAAGVQIGVFTLFNRVLGMYDLVSLAIGIAAAMLINFLVNNTWTWKWHR